MAERKKVKVLVSLEKRQLVLNSEVIKDYPQIQKLLQKYDKIYQSDFTDTEDFIPDVQVYFLYSFDKIVEEASKEWTASYDENEILSDDRTEWIRCSLCDTPNKYIFYIKNRLNGIMLNVGSDCIDKFPHLSDSAKGHSIDKIKRERVIENKRINRITKFNTRFPNAENMIEQWIFEYNNNPILLPALLHNKAKDIFIKSRNIYNSFINSKVNGSALDDFAHLITKYKLLEQEIKEFTSANIENKFACTLKIKGWLQEKHLANIIDLIINNGGMITRETIKNIYEESFVQKNLQNISALINMDGLLIDSIRDEYIYFIYTSIEIQHQIAFYCSTKALIENFGVLIFKNDKKIKDSDIIPIINPVWNEKNITNIINQLNSALKNTPFNLQLDFDKNEIEYRDSQQKFYSTGQALVFIKANYKLMFISDAEQKSKLLNLLVNKINWKSVEEKSKYDISDINRTPFS